MKYLVLISFMMTSLPALAADYNVDYAQSEIAFSGTHAGNEFNGIFEEWSAKISFDPDNLEASSLIAKFNTKTAKTGNAMYDGTLPQADWFDTKNHPEAIFISTSVTANEDGSYKASGDLTIKEIKQPISFGFTLQDLQASSVEVKANFPIDRFAFDIGKKSDPKAEWVSKEITLNIGLKASKQQ